MTFESIGNLHTNFKDGTDFMDLFSDFVSLRKIGY